MEYKEMEHFDVENIDEKWVKAVKSVYRCYPASCMPMGVCDMAYICNVLKNLIEDDDE